MAGINSNRCAILSFGITVNNDRMELVCPMGVDGNAAIDLNRHCKDIADVAEVDFLPLLLACLSSDAQVTFIQAVGMVAGRIPYRIAYASGAQPGTRASGPMPSPVGALMTYYADPQFPPPTNRIATPRNIIPGIAQADVVGDNIVVGLNNAIVTLQNKFILGATSTLYSPAKWFRVSGVNKNANQTLPTTVGGIVRNYIGSQRRRDIPH